MVSGLMCSVWPHCYSFLVKKKPCHVTYSIVDIASKLYFHNLIKTEESIYCCWNSLVHINYIRTNAHISSQRLCSMHTMCTCLCLWGARDNRGVDICPIMQKLSLIDICSQMKNKFSPMEAHQQLISPSPTPSNEWLTQNESMAFMEFICFILLCQDCLFFIGPLCICYGCWFCVFIGFFCVGMHVTFQLYVFLGFLWLVIFCFFVLSSCCLYFFI